MMIGYQYDSSIMDLLPDAYDCVLRIRWECRERFPRHRLQRKPLISYPGIHHGTCVTHVPWCMSGSLTLGAGKTFPAHAQPAILRIWQEAHDCQFAIGHLSFVSQTRMIICLRMTIIMSGRHALGTRLWITIWQNRCRKWQPGSTPQVNSGRLVISRC